MSRYVSRQPTEDEIYGYVAGGNDWCVFDGDTWVASFASHEHAERFAAELNHYEWAREHDGVDLNETLRQHEMHVKAHAEARAELNSKEREPTSKQRRLSERPEK